ncbi:LamG-like jellyroll fold domain-containing protein [Emticicia soli]|uniref:LamG-like jellyroll fold domain-containing protein n=1 Tax=Emticicia soli TaxID=2027878 RepID=A0ABW5JF63_9BACT
MKKLLPFWLILSFISTYAQQKRSLTPLPNMVADANYRVGCSLFNDPNNYTTGSAFSYSAPVNNNSYLVGPEGAKYGCLGSVPNQAWFVITVNTGGNLYFNISNSYGYDVDAAIWGPIINNDVANACASTQNSPLTCDFDTGRPDLYINNAQAGQKYLMLVTNYSNANTTIYISQPSGGSVTYAMVNLPNCSSLPTANISGESATINEGQAATLTLSFSGSGPWNYTLSDGTIGTANTSPININVYPTASQTYTINSVSNLCGTNSGTGSVGISVNRNIAMQSCFPLDGSVTDSKGINTGSLQNGVTTTTNRNNETNKALQFDGINDYVSLSANQLNQNTFAFAAWVKLDALPTSTNTEQVILSLGGSSDEHYLGVEYYNGAASWKFASNEAKVYSTATVNTGWHLLIGVRTGGQLKIYVDGALTGTSNVSGTSTFSSPLAGRVGGGLANNKFFKGKIDDIKFFRNSLIEPEVLLLQDNTSCNDIFLDTYISVQSISTSLICTTVTFTVRGITNNLTIEYDTPFIAELSDANGSFANPTVIGSSNFLPLTVVVPNTVAGGNHKLRIRYGSIVSINNFDVYINKSSTYNVTGTTAINDGQAANVSLNFTGTGPWNYVLSTGLSGVATTSPWVIPVNPDQTTTYAVTSSQNVCGNVSPNGNTSATVTVNFTKQNVTCLPFSGNATDQKGNNTTTVNGTLVPTENRYGQINAAYTFNGTSDYIEYTTNLLRKREYTMSAWVLANNISGGTQYIISQGETGTNTFQGLALTNWGWQFLSYSNNGGYYATSTTGWAANQWVHLTAVRTYQQLKLYVNGNLVAVTNSADNIPFKVSDIGRIGANSSYPSNFFNGKIDDVRLYKGALNDEEVFALFANTSNCPTVENSSIILVKSLSSASVCAGSNVSVSYTTSNITPTSGSPFIVQLSDQTGNFSNPTVIGSGISSPISVTIPASASNSSSYRVRIVSSGASPVTSLTTATLNINGALPTATISGSGTINYGSSTNLVINFTGTAPWTYSINNQTSQTTSTNPLTISVSPTTTTTYTLTSVSNTCGSGTVTGSAVVTVNPNITLGTLSIKTFCPGHAFTVPFTTNYTPNPNFKVELSDVNGSFANPTIIGTGTSSPISATMPSNPLGGTAYKIRIVSTSPAYTSPEFNNLTIIAKPTAAFSGDTTINIGGSVNLKITFTESGPWTYRINNGTTLTSSINPVIVPVSPTRTTTYSVTLVKNACGNGTATQSATVTVNPNITLGTIRASYCEGENIPVSFNANFTSTTGFRLELSDSTGSFANPTRLITTFDTPIVGVIPTSVVVSDKYKVRVVSDSPAFVSEPSTSFTTKKRPKATITAPSVISIGQSANLTINFTGVTPVTYAINYGSTQTADNSSFTIPVSPTTSTTYTITSIRNMCGVGTTGSNTSITVKNGPYLTSCFPFDGDVNDQIGNNVGTLYGGVSQTTDRFGNPNSAYSFDGVDGYIKLPITGLGATSDYSLSAWVNLTSAPSASNTFNIFTIGPPSGHELGNLHGFNINSDRVARYTRPCSGSVGQCNYEFGTALDLSTWYHLVVTRQGNVVRYYINGALKSSTNQPAVDQILNNYVAYIGKGVDSTNINYFSGKIDDIKIYRRALQISQVEALYNQTNCVDVSSLRLLSLEPISTKNVCKGANLTVNWSLHQNLTFPLKIQISDADGSFANPVEIGSGYSTSLTGKIPSYYSAGSRYRVRLISSDTSPVISNISDEIEIRESATATLSGVAAINEGEFGNVTINFTGQAPWTYALNGGTSRTTSTSPLTVGVAPVTNTTYTITSLSNFCGNGTSSGSATVTVTPVPIRLVSCYPFSGNTNDAKGINNATNTGATLTTDRFGVANRAYNFSEAAYVQSTPALNVENLEFTISMWFNFPNDQVLNSGLKIMDLSSNIFLLKKKADGKYAIQVTGSSHLGLDFYQFDLNNYTPGQWHSMIFVRSIGKLYLYLNNNLIANVVSNVGYEGASYGYPRRIIIGDGYVDNNPHVIGKIDDVQIYKGALTPGQINALYSNTQACFDATSYKCLSSATYSEALSGRQTLKAANLITGKSGIEAGANIYFDAKNAIILQPGFKTESNAIFTAKTGGGCVE